MSAGGGTIDYFQFEEIVGTILRHHLVNQGRSYEPHPRLKDRVEVDGWAPQGIDTLPAPTLVEIKYRAFITEQRDTIERLQRVAKATGAQSVLLILGTRISQQQEAAILGRAATLLNPPRFELWTLERVEELMKQYAEFIPAAPPEVAQRGVEQMVERAVAPAPNDEWLEQRKRNLAELKTQYQQGRVVLFLGAGASKDAGVPDWSALLHDLLLSLVTEKLGMRQTLSQADYDALVAALAGRPASPLMMARDIRAGLKDRFADEIARALYRKLAPGATSPTLQEIGRLCNNKAYAVVTYNFDDLLEQQLESFGRPYRSIYREDQFVQDDDELGIFHVHGFLPRDRGKDDLAESLLVFSEEGYHAMFGDPFSWSNVVQFGFLRERTCLLVGLSASDPNLRRLAEYAAKRARAPRHFIFLKRDPPPEAFAHAHASAELPQAFDNINHGLQEAAFRELGLTVIWFKDYGEVPLLLESLRKP